MERKDTPEKPKRTGRMSGRELGEIVLETVFHRFLAIKAAVPLLLGAAMLSSAIGFWRNTGESESLGDRLTGTASGQVLEAWWRLDFPVAKMADASNWLAFVDPQFCARTSYATAAGPQQRSTACATFGRILDFTQGPYQLGNINSPAGNRALPWRDRAGQPTVGLKFSPEAWAFLTETVSPYAFTYRWWSPFEGFGEEGAMTYWQAFQKDFDNPPHYLKTLWQFPPATPLRVDPQDSGAAIPASFLNNADYRELNFVAPVLGFAGAVFWTAGLYFFLFGMRRRTWLAAALVSLALAPWWGNWIYRGLDQFLPEAADIAGFLENLFLPSPSAVALMPAAYAGEPSDTGFRWSLKTSHYAPLYQGMDLPPPDRALTEAQATQRLEQLLTQSLADLPLAQQQRRLTLLICYAKSDFRAGGYPFLPWARTLMEHPELGPAASQFVEFQEGSGVYFGGPSCEP